MPIIDRQKELHQTGQTAHARDIAIKLGNLIEQLDTKLPLWNRLPPNKQSEWLRNDPVLKQAKRIGRYLANNFPELIERKDND